MNPDTSILVAPSLPQLRLCFARTHVLARLNLESNLSITTDLAAPGAAAAYRSRASICALITPFLLDLSIDYAALARLIEYQIAGGTDALVIAGSTGESVSLETEEFAELIKRSVEIAAGRIGIIAGTGTPSTARSIHLGAIAAAAGAEAVLVVTPAYCRPTQEGLFEHYRQIADASALPVILYNVPTRTAVDMLPETVARLCRHPRIAAIKEAVPDVSRLNALIALQGPDFEVLSGDDPTAVQAIRMGARGLISVCANVRPAAMRTLVYEAISGAPQSQNLNAWFDALAAEPNPIPVKWAAQALGLCDGGLRLPLTALSPVYHAPLQALIDDLNVAALAA